MSFEALQPILRLLPEIKTPAQKPNLKKRLIWTGIVLVLFFLMGQISLVGLDKTSQAFSQLEIVQIILASPMGSLISAGIGPIVLASIILQLLIGAGIIKLNLHDQKERAIFSSMQKMLAIILAFFEAGAYTGFGIFPAFISPLPGMAWIVILQIAVGSILLLYLDEIVSKYGFGSGVGLFIAGGVAQTVLWNIFRIPGLRIGDTGGRIFMLAGTIARGSFVETLIILLPIIFTLLVFLVVVYAEAVHVNIPITMGLKGMGGRYPVKLLYVSNMPVILAVALFANFQLWALLAKSVPYLGTLLSGIAAITNSPQGLLISLIEQGFPVILVFQQMGQTIINFFTYIITFGGVQTIMIGLGGQVLQAIIYLILLVVICVLFGKFWVELGGQGPEQVADQLASSQMFIPGFRKDKRIILMILEKYIPPITILGSVFVALLAGLADITGAIGSGTGILLTVGIVYRLYEELAREQVISSNLMLQKFFGKGGGF